MTVLQLLSYALVVMRYWATAGGLRTSTAFTLPPGRSPISPCGRRHSAREGVGSSKTWNGCGLTSTSERRGLRCFTPCRQPRICALCPCPALCPERNGNDGDEILIVAPGPGLCLKTSPRQRSCQNLSPYLLHKVCNLRWQGCHGAAVPPPSLLRPRGDMQPVPRLVLQGRDCQVEVRDSEQTLSLQSVRGRKMPRPGPAPGAVPLSQSSPDGPVGDCEPAPWSTKRPRRGRGVAAYRPSRSRRSPSTRSAWAWR